jgi:hypothetical protein
MQCKFIVIFLFSIAVVYNVYGGAIDLPAPADTITFSIPNVEGPQYTEVLVPVTVAAFDSVDSFFFDISWDSTLVSYRGAKNMLPEGLTIADYDAVDGVSNRLELFFQDNLVSLSDGTVIFWLRFYLIGPEGSSSPLAITDLTVQVNNYQDTQLKKSLDGSIQINAANPITFRVGHVKSEPYSDVYVPVTVENFFNVDSFSFDIVFDSDLMYFVEFISLHPDLFGGQVHQPPYNRVELFFQGNATLPGQTVVCYLIFHVKGPNGTLTPLSIVGNDYVYVNNYQPADSVQSVDGSILIDTIVAPKEKETQARIRSHESAVGVTSVEKVDRIQFHPNPCRLNARISVWSNNDQQSDITITSSQGKKTAQINFPLKKGPNALSVDTSGLPSGMYILNIRFNNRIETLKFIKD